MNTYPCLGPVEITDNPRAAAAALSERLAARYGTTLSEDELLDSPHVFYGTVNQLVDKIQSLRERFGISYALILGDMRAFAPVVERLAGRELAAPLTLFCRAALSQGSATVRVTVVPSSSGRVTLERPGVTVRVTVVPSTRSGDAGQRGQALALRLCPGAECGEARTRGRELARRPARARCRLRSCAR